MAFRFVGTRITGPRGDSGVLVFCADADTAFTDRDRLVFFLSRPDGGMVMKRTMKIDEIDWLEWVIASMHTAALAPGVYVWSARYVLGAVLDSAGGVTGGDWVETPWRNCEFEVLEVNGQICR